MFALAAFLILLVVGLVKDELRWLQAGLFVIVAVGWFFAIAIFQWPPILFMTGVAILDVILVLIIFRGDVRI